MTKHKKKTEIEIADEILRKNMPKAAHAAAVPPRRPAHR